MKKLKIHFAVVLIIMIGMGELSAQSFSQPTKFFERNLGGPRLGFTLVPGKSTIAKKLKENKIGMFISQFGWHLEYQGIPAGGGPQFVVEFLPLIAGVEYGTFIPSASLALGIRFPEGYEFGLGPNLLLGGAKLVTSALVIAVGKTIDYGGVSIPLNLAIATNPDGNRYSFIVGYAIPKF